MRIALVVPVFPQLSETFIAAKVVGLVDRGHDVHVVCGASEPHHWAAYGPDHPVHAVRDRVHVTAPTRPGRAAAGGVARAAALAVGDRGVRRAYLGGRDPRRGLRDLYLDSTLVALAPDLVHFEFGSLARGRLHLRDRLGAAVTASFRGHDLLFVGLDDPAHLRDVWADLDRAHLVSEALWAHARHRGAPADLAHDVIRPALDAAALRPAAPRPGRLGTVDEPLRVVSVGRLSWIKGYDVALEAIALLAERGVHVRYRVVGTGPLHDALGFWRHDLGLDDRVELVGAVAPGDVAGHQRWADVQLHAAAAEGFGNAVLEAQALGVPVVASDGGGLPENVLDGVTGRVVPRRDPAALADALAGYAADPGARASAGRAGRERAIRDFHLAGHLDAWERFHECALLDRGAPAGRSVPSGARVRPGGASGTEGAT